MRMFRRRQEVRLRERLHAKIKIRTPCRFRLLATGPPEQCQVGAHQEFVINVDEWGPMNATVQQMGRSL